MNKHDHKFARALVVIATVAVIYLPAHAAAVVVVIANAYWMFKL